MSEPSGCCKSAEGAKGQMNYIVPRFVGGGGGELRGLRLESGDSESGGFKSFRASNGFGKPIKPA